MYVYVEDRLTLRYLCPRGWPLLFVAHEKNEKMREKRMRKGETEREKERERQVDRWREVGGKKGKRESENKVIQAHSGMILYISMPVSMIYGFYAHPILPIAWLKHIKPKQRSALWPLRSCSCWPTLLDTKAIVNVRTIFGIVLYILSDQHKMIYDEVKCQ